MKLKRLLYGPLLPALFALAVFLWFVFCVKTATAGEIILSWTTPTDTVTETYAGPYDNPAGTKIWQLVADVDDPDLETYTLEGYEPGDYAFVATAYDTNGVGSRISGEATKTVASITVSDNKAYTVVKSGGKFVAFIIGTVPVGTECDPDNMVKGLFNFLPFTGYVVPISSATITGDVEPSAVVAVCQ